MKILITLAAFFAASTAFGQTVVLHPNEVTGEFTAKVNSATNDIRIDRVCLFRIDANSPDPTEEFACQLVGDGSIPLAGEEAPSFEGLVYNITFTTVLVPGESQKFVARNIASDIGGELVSAPTADFALIPARPTSPIFLIVSP